MSTEIPVDDETRAALLLFNERLDEARAQERADKRIAKAERAKDEAAKRVRNLAKDSSATPEKKDEAEVAYKAAVAEFTRIKENPHEEPKKPAPADTTDTESDTVENAEESAPTAETEPTETSADEEPSTTAVTNEQE